MYKHNFTQNLLYYVKQNKNAFDLTIRSFVSLTTLLTEKKKFVYIECKLYCKKIKSRNFHTISKKKKTLEKK